MVDNKDKMDPIYGSSGLPNFFYFTNLNIPVS